MNDVKKPTQQMGAWPFQKDHVQPCAKGHGVFTKAECEKIIALGTARGLSAGTVVVDASHAVQEADKQERDSLVSWIGPEPETAWLFEKVSNLVLSTNEKVFGFDLYGMIEGFQFTKYEAPNGFHGRHADNGYSTVIRKLSLVIQLSPSEDFDGGRLLIHNSSTPSDLGMEQGTAVIFPSYILHEVTHLTRGVRYSLVGWVTGAPFK